MIALVVRDRVCDACRISPGRVISPCLRVSFFFPIGLVTGVCVAMGLEKYATQEPTLPYKCLAESLYMLAEREPIGWHFSSVSQPESSQAARGHDDQPESRGGNFDRGGTLFDLVVGKMFEIAKGEQVELVLPPPPASGSVGEDAVPSHFTRVQQWMGGRVVARATTTDAEDDAITAADAMWYFAAALEVSPPTSPRSNAGEAERKRWSLLVQKLLANVMVGAWNHVQQREGAETLQEACELLAGFFAEHSLLATRLVLPSRSSVVAKFVGFMS